MQKSKRDDEDDRKQPKNLEMISFELIEYFPMIVR